MSHKTCHRNVSQRHQRTCHRTESLMSQRNLYMVSDEESNRKFPLDSYGIFLFESHLNVTFWEGNGNGMGIEQEYPKGK